MIALMQVRVLALIFVVLAFAAAPALAAPATWRVKGPAGEALLLGSMHVLTPEVQWRTPAMDGALARATSVWFEVPLDPASRAQAARTASARGRMKVGDRLTDVIGAAGRTRLSRTAREMLVPIEALDRLQPWLAETMLTLAWIERRGGRQDLGVDEQIWRLAPAGAAKRAFETPGEQITMMAGAPLKDQATSLNETLKMLSEDPGAFDRLQSAWLKPDLETLKRENVDALREVSPELYRRLVADRNLKFADEIERLLKTPERAFIVVGVGHLVGPDGVPELLRRRGLVVEGP